MFGYVQANLNDLSPEEQARYRAAYCGLCRTLGKRYGWPARMGLTYDLTFRYSFARRRYAFFISSWPAPWETPSTL